MIFSGATRVYLAIVRDGKNPVELEEFDKYFEIICSDGQITLPVVYPSSDDGVKKWNTKAIKSKRLDFYLLKSKSDKLMSIKEIASQIIDALSGASYDADALTCIAKFITDNHPEIDDRGKKMLDDYFTNPETLKDCFQLSEETLKGAKGELEKHPEYFQLIIAEVIENVKKLFEDTKGVDVEVLHRKIEKKGL